MNAKLHSPRRVSIFAVAKIAKCSIATVSNVLNQKGRVSSKKRSEVLRAVKQLGYQVSSVGRSLRTRRLEVVGLLFYPSCAQIFKNPFYAEILEGLEEDLTKRGYHLLLAGYEVSVASSGVPKFLLQGKVDGMILLGAFPTEVIRSFMEFPAPLVLLDGNVEYPIDSVISDGFSAEIDVVDHLYQRGHRNILMLGYNLTDYNIDLRVQGFLAGLAQFGLTGGEKQVIRHLISHDDIYPALRKRMKESNPPTAIVTINDTLAMEMIARLRKDGIRVPQDISVVGYDDDVTMLDGRPFLSTVAVDKKALGRMGAELVINRINSPGNPAAKLRLPVRFVSRSSVADIQV